ncbi:MAG: hypothetical protein ABIP68_02190 [Ferruginibacter sp.]
MAIDLLKATTEKLGYQPLKTVSSVNREVNEDANNAAQAIIPSVLVAFLNLAETDDGLALISNYNGNDWPTILFNEKKNAALENISKYSGFDNDQLIPEINKASRTVVNIINEEVKGSSNYNSDIKNLLNSQRKVILDHLPVSLDMGTMLSNDTIDDHTTKMQGPFSSFVQKITENFGKNETDEELDKKSQNF